MTRDDVARWVARYEKAWRSPKVEGLRELFAEDASYIRSPWAEPIVGLPAIGAFWEGARSGADEAFEMESSIVALDGSTAVVRVAVEYGTGDRWRDLWVIRFDGNGRCEVFEEWPFAPGQPDGHEAKNP